jgi:ATP-binding cassette, subfamily B, bacterial MsbA
MKRFSIIFKYLRGYKTNIVLYFIFIILSIVFSVVSLATLPTFLKLLFGLEHPAINRPVFSWTSTGIYEYIKYLLSDIINKHSKIIALAYICVTIIISVFLKNIFLYFSYYVLAPMRNGVMTKLRADLYNKILVLPIGYFTEQKKGDLMSRMSNDANEVEWSVMSTLEVIIKEPLNIIFYLTLMIVISPKLSLMLLLFLPSMAFIIGRVSRSLKRQSTAAQEKNGLALSILDETLGGIRVIKAFTAEKLLQGKFLNVNTELNNIRNRMNFRRDLASPMSEFLGVLVLCGVLLIGGNLVLNNPPGNTSDFLNAEGFIAYILFFTQIINPAKALSTAFYNVQRGSSAIKRIEEILQAPVVIEEAANPTPFTSFNHCIELRSVTFAYDDVVILDDINLSIEKGKTIALVGSSGAGKSTLADLVPRFHDVTSGELLIDGVNIKNYSLHSLRSQMSIVTQEPILFNDTIANNISLGKSDATKEEIMNAAKIANAHNFIIQKEEGYDTNIGDRGSKLSGGERQRLTIARAVLKNPPILILDEATSSLDTESERLVQDAINNMMQNRTSIVIAHRLSTIRHANEIIVLQKGKIVERGTHDQLMQQAGFYRRLVDMQEVK